jgi:hypothetical protein
MNKTRVKCNKFIEINMTEHKLCDAKWNIIFININVIVISYMAGTLQTFLTFKWESTAAFIFAVRPNEALILSLEVKPSGSDMLN